MQKSLTNGWWLSQEAVSTGARARGQAILIHCIPTSGSNEWRANENIYSPKPSSILQRNPMVMSEAKISTMPVHHCQIVPPGVGPEIWSKSESRGIPCMYSLADFRYLLVHVLRSQYEDVVGSFKLVVRRRIRSKHVEPTEWSECSVILVCPAPLIHHGLPDPPNSSCFNDARCTVLLIKVLV